ncbi:S8 family serine peptidase [Bacillus sp. 03113]|uniref:S8 family peptidase n=1 Tax=Bacillus sp. 03113 TaxID=2578211 RepID=UPI001144738F|nr:S8 family serine peptidase [Bacillus sp. 03113]
MNLGKKVLGIAASSILALSLSTFTFSQNTYAASQSLSKNYLIAYGQALPKDYQNEIEEAGGEVVAAIPEIGGVEVHSSDPNFLKQIKQNTKIVAANIEKNFKLEQEEPSGADSLPVTLTPDPDGTYWSYQWDMQRLTNQKNSYALETGGTEIDEKVEHKAIVGIIDSGIDYDHPDLKANFVGGRNFVPAGGYYSDNPAEKGDPNDVLDLNGHGTHVAGSIAGNGKVKGVGPDLGVRAYRIFDANGSAPTSPIVQAIVAAANDQVDVINMSIGGFDNLKYYYEGERYNDVADVVLWKRAVQYAVNKNVTVVTAAGNESLNYNDKKSLTDYMNEVYGEYGILFKGVSIEVPGGTPGVINVSSSNSWSTDKLAFYSNYGNGFIDVAAPGGDNGPTYDATSDLNKRDFTYRTLSAWPTYLEPYFTTVTEGYAFSHGTSMAAPKVAGIAGVIKAAHPNYTPAQVKALIAKTSFDYGKKGNDPFFGAGEANAFNALIYK